MWKSVKESLSKWNVILCPWVERLRVVKKQTPRLYIQSNSSQGLCFFPYGSSKLSSIVQGRIGPRGWCPTVLNPPPPICRKYDEPRSVVQLRRRYAVSGTQTVRGSEARLVYSVNNCKEERDARATHQSEET